MTQPTPLARQTTQTASRARPYAPMVNRLVIGMLLINLVAFALAGLSIYQSRLRYQERAEITTQNLARVLEENIDGALDKIDIALLSAQDEVARQIAAGGIDAKTLNAFLAQQQEHQPEIMSLRATDAEGVVRYGPGVPTTGGPHNADREYYIRARDEAPPGLIVTKPVFTRIDKKWAFVIARRLSKFDGSFAGVVYVNVALGHLSKLFSEINVGPHGSVTLRDRDAGLVVRYPETQSLDRTIGSKPSLEIQKLTQAGRSSETLHSIDPLDNIARTLSYRKLADKPFFILVGVAPDDYLAVWRQESIKTAALMLLFTLATLFSSWLIYRSWKHLIAATETLAAQEAKFRTVADYTYDWEYWLGPNREVLYISSSCERVTGYSPAEFEADPELFSSIVLPADRHIMEAHLRDDMYHDEALVDFRIVRRDGDIRWIIHGCRAVYGPDGQFLGRRVSNRDNTERKLAEEELQRSNAELEQFSYAISHDMRQPLRMISSYLQLIEKRLAGQLDGEKREFFDFAIDGAQRLDQMLLALLEYSRVGRKGEPPEWNESRALLDEALLFLQPAIAEAQAELHISGDWPRVFVSRDEMVRLIQNLIGNAVKYRIAERKPEITVSSEMADNEWRLSVSDNGVGIIPDQIGRLFQMFQRLHTRAAYEGTGIGLALCRKIAEHHGGSIAAESPGVGQGSTFRVRLPVKQDESITPDESGKDG